MEKVPVKKYIPPVGPVDLKKRVQLTATEKHPTRKAGEVFNPSYITAEKFKLNGWAK